MTFFKKQQDTHKARQLRMAIDSIAKSHDGKVLCEMLLEPSLKEADKGIRMLTEARGE